MAAGGLRQAAPLRDRVVRGLQNSSTDSTDSTDSRQVTPKLHLHDTMADLNFVFQYHVHVLLNMFMFSVDRCACACKCAL